MESRTGAFSRPQQLISLIARRAAVDSCRKSGQKFSVLVWARFCLLLHKWFNMAYVTTPRINKKWLPCNDGSSVTRVENYIY